MGKPFWRSVEYFFTGNYSADDGNNSIVAIGFGGEIHAYGGDDHVTVGSIGATVYTGSGNDTVVGGSAYLRVEDTTGHLSVKGAAGYADINKSGDGNVSFAGAAGGVSIDHLGNHGDVNYGGAAAYNGITRKGLSGNVTFKGAGGYNALWHETNQGNLSFAGAGAGNKLDRTWFNRYQDSRGDVTFDGAGAANSISSRVETGNITFRGAGADNHLVRKGKVGDVTLQGAGASNRIERTRQAEDVYVQTRGNIRFEGVGGYNSLYSDVAHGDIHLSGGGAYNTIIRKGSGNDFAKEGMTNAKVDDIVLTKAVMSGSWIGQNHQVTAVKSASEPNTYLFAFADSTYTKINKVQLRNDPQTGELRYYSTAWYKEGNHLNNLANQDITNNGGFTAVNINGAYTLSDLKVEHQQSVTVHAVEKSLTEYEWVTYANGAVIDAKDVSLSEAKMGGDAIYADGTKVDVQAVKSNRKPNTYVYAKLLGRHTKIVVVELANDPKTGALKYQARSWYKEGDHTADLANEDISSANGYHSMGKGGYSLSDLHYSVNAVRSTSETVADIDEYTDQTLFKPATDSGESSGDVHFNGAGGGNVIKSNVTRGNVYFNGGGIANVILHSSQFGHTEFNGGGAANVIVKSGEEGDLTFRGAGLANVLVHQSKQGKMDVYAGGAVNVLVRIGDGQYLAHLLAYGNISVHKGNGNSRVVMLGGYNTHTQIGSGNGLWLAAGGFNVMTQVGKGDVASVLAGGANVLTKVGDGDLTAGMLGGANVITHISGDNETSNTTAVALGGANILTKKGKGNALAVMGGGANVLTHVGDGTTTGVMVGGANILTKVGNGDTTGIMLGVGNVLTHVGDGQTLGVMGAAGNIFTKVGDGTSIAVMIGAGNIFTHVGEGNAWALMGGLGNVFTKVGNGDALALMVAEANVFTHIGDGMSVALMLAKGNVATKVGNGTTLAAMVGNANIFTHVGSGSTFAVMIGQANIMTKVGDDLTAALMVGKANIYTHVGDGTSLGIFAGEVNVMTKVGNGTTLAAMFGKANIMTHVGDGLTGVLALGEANIVTKVGDDFMGVVAAAKANVVTHVGDATTAAVLAGKGNILTKVGEGTTVGLLISDIGNVMTHVGDGTTIGIAKGKANIITKVGDGLGVNVAWGQANVFTQVGDGDRYNFAKGEANVITKVGDGQEVSVVQGKANIITHVGNGDDYTGAWGKANVITKVGNGRNVVLAKGEANIVTQVGDGDSFNALWSKGNIVTKVGDGMQVTAAKGKANITTTVGDGLSVTAAYGDANINTKVGDGVSVNVAWGKYNINTKVGDGLNVAVMKGKANANIHIGDGLGINASYAQNNVAIKIGNGDFYSLAVASSNTSSNKLSALFDNIKQTVLGVGGSQAINYLVQGDEASSSGTQKGRGAIATPEITKLDGFQMDAIEEVGSDLGDSLTGSVTKVDTPDLNKMQNALDVDGSSDQTQAPNLIVNGDFEQGDQGWKSTHGVEASYSGNVYGVNGEGHGARVTELDTYTNTSLYQDLTDLTEGEVIAVSFDFAKRAGLSNNEGIEVLWNGEVVFSSSGDASAWQQKTLKLTAHAGSNRIEFKGTGQNDGLGYILDNVVAKSESSQQANAVSEHATQNQASQNALSDKERAEADRQRLEQEKQKQLDAVAGSQSQLESTDQKALENNGQAQRDAVKEESEAVTAELTKLAQGLDVLDEQATHTGESGDQWRNDFAGGLLDGVQRQLDDAKQLANDKIAAAKQTQSDNNSKVKESVAKSEAGVAKGEQNRAGAEQDIADAKADAETRKADAVAKSNDAKQAESDAHSAANDAQSRGDRDAMNAEDKANQAQNDAKGTKQNEGERPDREGVTGSGLSGNAHRVEGAGETGSHVTNDSQTNADGRFSEGLSEQEQEALEGATNAVNRLQINAGIRGKNSGSTISSMFTETNSDSIVVPTAASQDVVRQEIRISGVNLEGLSGGQGSQTTGQHSSKSVPGFQSHFASTSIGIENELSGLVVVLPKNSAQTFGYVHDSQGNPLFMLTKDMNQGGYSNPAGITDINGLNNWQTHTIELVTYPSETSDTTAIESRKEAMLWLAKEFTGHINQSNHQSLPQLVSEDGRFTLVISNSKHLIAAGNGTAIEAQGQTIGMTPSGQQATMAISAKEFGSSSSLEVRLLESAPWYQSGLRDEFLANSNEHKLDDPEAAQNVYAYLTSVYSKTADLAKEYGIYINDWDPASEGFSPNAQGLTDPKVKNAWEILPRTKPVKMLELLSADDSRYVRQQIIEKLKGSHSESLAKNVFEYFQYGGEVAGHGINNATTGSAQQPEPAILFEFRSVPSVLSEFVPKTESTAKVDVKALDHFDSASRKAIIVEVNALVSGSDDFDAWYQEYRASKGQPPVKNPKSSASANHKAEWLMTQYADKWAKITAPYIESNETSTSTQTTVDSGEVLKGLQEDFKRYGDALKVTLKGEAGRLTGYYHQGAASSEGETSATSGKVVLFLHGSGSSAEEQASAIRNHYQKQGIDMLAVNLRGYGESDGGPSEKGLYQDARTMFNYLVNDKGIDPSNIIIHGYSMGGPIAADLARYAAQNGQAVSGLLLDRPMPSMTKAITAHEVANPAGIVGAIAKAVNGQFSVEKNLKGLPKETPILLLTDNEGLGEEGEKLRAKLAIAGYNVTGEQTFYGHEASNRLMGQYADQIVSGLFNAEQAAVEVKDIRATEDLSVVKTVASDTELGTNTDVPHKNYQSRDLVLEPIVQPETIELGMPDIDQKILAEVAERENVIIGVRPVDEKSKSLIDSKLYSSKGLFVKAKSSDWGPMSGFIPVDQAFAKASARRDLDKFNDYAEQSIESGNAVSADLYLNQVRIDELVSKYQSLTALEFDAESGMYKTTATNGDQTVTFFLNKVTVDSKDLWQVHYIKDGKLAPFKVIGDPVSKQPMTADYDLLTVMYSYSDLGPQDKVKQPLTWEQWKESVTYEELTPKYKELYNSEVLYNKKDGASLGVVSDRLKALKDVINTSLGRTDGLEMVHHGADDANPYAVMADNFPATFFVPKSFFMEDGLGEGKGSIQTYFNVNEQGAVVIRDPQEFSNFQQVAINVSYRASLNDKWNVGLDDPLFTPKRKLSHDFLNAKEEVVKKLSGEVEDLDQQRLDTTSTKDQGTSDKNDHLQVVDSKEALADGKILHNQNVNDWERVVVTPTADGGETRFDGQIIVQMENDAVAAKAAANLAGKHPESSVVVQLDSDGNYRVVYGDPSKLDGKLRWQLVGHGRDHSESNNTRLSGYSADELAVKLASFQQMFNQAEKISSKPDHISIVGCSLVSDDKQKGFGHQFINAMDANGLRVDVSVRSAKVYINEMGRKLYFDGKDSWVNKAINSKVLLSWNGQGEVVAKDERIRNGIAEGDIDLSRIGISDVDEPARGAIGDNNDVFDAPEKRKAETETSSSSANNKLSYSGNIQVNVGDGEFTAVNWGTSNVGIKVGTGGFKSLAFGDNNVMVHIGNGESKHSFDIGGYQALEGAQMFIGNRNVSFNLGRSNDLIVMMDKSIPTPPLVNPFDGAARISGVLQSIATSGEGQDWLAAQEQQWTLSGAKKFVKDMSGLDQSSSVDYTSLVELDSQNERSSRGLKHDAEAALNKQYNQWLSGNSDSDTSKLSRADKLRQANEKLAFNFAVGGQGADIQVTTGNWNFMFGDNIQSILDTNLGSLFGLMTQQFSATGQAKTTFTYTPEDLPRQLKNKLLGQLAGVGAETTLADIFGVDYTASGQIVSRNGEAVDGVAILKEMLEVIGEFSGDQLQAFVDPAKLLDSLKAGIKTGADGIKSFAETHGLKEKAPEEEEDNSSVSVNGASVNSAQGATVADGSTETAETPDRAFGFNSLNLPNLFATIFSQDKQKEMKSLVENLKENLTADLLNMKEKTFDFLRNSGHLQGDGDINISLGNYNFNWGGDGKDLGAYLGDNNNFWGGRGDDVFYATGTSNIFTGGEGNDMGVLMGRENMMFGGDGNDTAVVAGRINHVFLGAGDDQSFVFGEGGEIDTGSGRDYVVTSGNFNRVDTGDDQDYSVTIGNNNQVELGAGNDFANVFGNYNRINASAGNDVVKLMGYHAVLNGGEGEDHLIAAAISKFSQFNGGEGRDLMVLGGYQNTFKGGTDVDSFVVSGDVIDNLVEDIRSEDNIVFNGIDWQKLWFERSGYDLKLSILRDPASDSDQAKFEHIGSVTFSDYFNGNRAQVIIAMGEKDATGEREYTTLSESAIDALVQAMSGFDPQAGDNGFIDNLDSKSRVAITTAWADVVHKKGITV